MVRDFQGVLLDLYCLVRFVPLRLGGWMGGRQLEQLFVDYCLAHNVGTWQGPFNSALFGIPPASGQTYEIDGGVSWREACMLFEMKAYDDVVPREQIMTFNQKSLEFYLSLARESRFTEFWRVFMSRGSTSESVRRFCYFWRIVTVDPDLIPLPVVIRVLRSDHGQEYFSTSVLAEAERVLGPLSEPLSSVFRMNDERTELNLSIRGLPSKAVLRDAVDMHKQLSDEILGVLEEENPRHLEDMADRLLRRMGRRWVVRTERAA